MQHLAGVAAAVTLFSLGVYLLQMTVFAVALRRGRRRLARATPRAAERRSTVSVLVENRNVDCSVRRTIERHTRWAKIRRAMSPVGFALEPLLTPIVVATAAVVLAPTRLGIALLGACVVLQTAGAWAGMRLLRGRALPWYLAPLEIVRSYLLFACWARAWLSRRVSWRGHDLRIGPHTRLEPAPPSALRRVLAYVRG